MNPLPTCLLYTQDLAFTEQVCGYLKFTVKVYPVESEHQLEIQLRQMGAILLLVDLRGGTNRNLIEHVRKKYPQTLVIAFGVPRSNPMIEVESVGIYAAEDIEIQRQRFQSLIARAIDHLKLTLENQVLREENVKAIYTANLLQRKEKEATPPPLRHLYRAFRHFDNVETLLDNIVEGVASSTMVSRVGIFSWIRSKETYQLRAGLRCLEETSSVEYTASDPLVRWMEVHAHLISRATLDHIKDPSERMLLKQSLQSLGAEVIIPLHSRGRIIGWLFVGSRATGLPFNYSDLEDLMVVAEHISTNLDNALLYEEASVQKTLLETLVHSMPTGIVVVGEDCKVHWFNNAAQKLLAVSSDQVLHKSLEILGSRMTDLIRRTLNNQKIQQPSEWIDPLTKRSLSIQTRRLIDKDKSVGVVVMIEDRTAERMLHEKQEQLKRTTFWTELAASMSHQIRNPLVAIRTFVQLLPERYEDPEFRDEFWKLVPREIDRLDKTIDQINRFAHPPELNFKSLNVQNTVQKGINLARSWLPKDLKIETLISEDLPKIKGDENAIAECFAHLLTNAIEATANRKNPRIVLAAKRWRDMNRLVVTVQDNGGGISPQERDKVFSPFCTSKALGMGLGLPIVQRTVLDHNGQVHIDSNGRGTCVTITLPADSPNGSNESHLDS